MNDMHKVVVAGAEWLDETRPGWEQEIDLSSLFMADCSMCVLGQVFGNYFTGLNHVNSDEDDISWSNKHGFLLSDPTMGSDWDMLRDTWIILIKERFDTGNLSG